MSKPDTIAPKMPVHGPNRTLIDPDDAAAQPLIADLYRCRKKLKVGEFKECGQNRP
ncbi:hypothetical protein SAMN05444287_0011 [Octadecabacter temperatus]|uniref:Uncharacterized protein n=1 Tax=Octadecabacter temperatus TaxID=1458307 RepID=A0A0K0Y1Z3_9RHOB|nr:hypothetical protein OSB_03600 [Octadecabacter temperatus]SIN82863.1 hypothetical protein SAMN05444287_0011 [Octadecabacter temperatus]